MESSFRHEAMKRAESFILIIVRTAQPGSDENINSAGLHKIKKDPEGGFNRIVRNKIIRDKFLEFYCGRSVLTCGSLFL